MSGQLFIVLFFPGMGVFLAGAGFLWWVSIKERELKGKGDGQEGG
jgi:hypothetical protein